MLDHFSTSATRRPMTGGVVLWQDDRNAAHHDEYLDFARRATERQRDRMLRMMPVFPDARDPPPDA